MSNRKDLLDYIRAYCNQSFYGDVVAWADETEYEIGDIVIAPDTHTYKSETEHTSNDNPPPDNETDWEYTEETLPGGVRQALAKMEEFMSNDMAKQSESLGDYSVTFSSATNWGNWPPHIGRVLQPYRKVGF